MTSTRLRWRRGAHAAMSAAALLLGACSDSPTDSSASAPTVSAELVQQYDKPFVTGTVARLPKPDDDWGYLVLGRPQPNGDPNGAFFHPDRSAIRWEAGGPAPVSALTLGRHVSVWVDPGSVVLQSLPPRIQASVIVIHAP